MNEREQFYHDFIEAWWASRTLDEVCERIEGMDKRQASNEAAMLRRKGVNLPKRPCRSREPNLTEPVAWLDLQRWAETCESKARNQEYRRTEATNGTPRGLDLPAVSGTPLRG